MTTLKGLHDHFGDKIDDVYACILGPYGEGNYPLMVPDWVNMGHCHEGYWCGDEFAIKAFQAAMRRKYAHGEAEPRVGQWLSVIRGGAAAPELTDEKFKPSPEAFPTPQAKRRWLDFIMWYHQAIIDFAGESLKTVLKYFPGGEGAAQAGRKCGWGQPDRLGDLLPRLCEDGWALPRGPATGGLPGAVFGDKWMGTAYQYYGVKECTEPAGGLDGKSFVRRMFSDASCGAASSLRTSLRPTPRIFRNTSTSARANRARRRSRSFARRRSIAWVGVFSLPSTPPIPCGTFASSMCWTSCLLPMARSRR